MALLAVTGSSAAVAGPEVAVIFKNNSTAAAVYQANDSNEMRTRVNASPKPDNEVNPRESNTYRVQGNISPDVNHATVHYTVGSKRCKFTTSYLKSRVRGVVLPKWNKSAIGSGGARCEAKITSVNPATHAWVVEFTMR